MSRRNATIRLKRAYEPPAEDDGTRILVERLWPDSVTKERAAIDLWLKELAPGAELRKWYSHDQTRWAEFRLRYWSELEQKAEAIRNLKRRLEEGPGAVRLRRQGRGAQQRIVLKDYLQRYPRS